MIDWTNLICFSSVAAGGFIATTYETIARRKLLTVGKLFEQYGTMNLLGGIIGLLSFILSAFFNPWWSAFIVFLIAWFISQTFINIFKGYAQYISVLLILLGIIFLLINLL